MVTVAKWVQVLAENLDQAAVAVEEVVGAVLVKLVVAEVQEVREVLEVKGAAKVDKTIKPYGSVLVMGTAHCFNQPEVFWTQIRNCPDTISHFFQALLLTKPQVPNLEYFWLLIYQPTWQAYPPCEMVYIGI